MANMTSHLETPINVVPSFELTDESKANDISRVESSVKVSFFTPNQDKTVESTDIANPTSFFQENDINFNSKASDEDSKSRKKGRKSKYHNQSKRELITSIKRSTKQEIFLNLFNVDETACDNDIKEFFGEINIAKVIKNTNKTGNWDLKFTSKEEAIKLVLKGNGQLKDRYFFVRDSYRNNFIYDDKDFFEDKKKAPIVNFNASEKKFDFLSTLNTEEKMEFNPFIESTKKGNGLMRTPNMNSASTYHSSAFSLKENQHPNVQKSINSILKGIFEGMNDNEQNQKESPIVDLPKELREFNTEVKGKEYRPLRNQANTSAKGKFNKLR